jgi:hypothetical protein
VAHKDCGTGAECVEHAYEVADQMKDRVLIDRLRPVALAVTAHIGRDDVESRRGERSDLMAPRIPAFRKAMAQHDQRPGTLLGDIDADAVGFNDPLRRLCHGRSSRAGLRQRFRPRDRQRRRHQERQGRRLQEFTSLHGAPLRPISLPAAR